LGFDKEFAMDGVDKSVLARMPLAEAVLVIWRCIADEDRLQAIFERHRGRCYEGSISFATMVQLVADALLEHQGSGHQSFSRAKEAGSLEASTRAAYGKLGRLPVTVSVGLFSEIAGLLGELFPPEARREPPASLRDVAIITVDGKTIKRVAKRLKPLRTKGGGVIGGKALVASERSTGLAVAIAADLDGDANDARLVPELLPQVRERLPGQRLWVADRGFCDPLQLSRFAAEGDSFVMRYNAKAKFSRDEQVSLRQGTDAAGRRYSDECGWLGREGNAHRRYVRRVKLFRENGEDVAIVTDLVDHRKHPAEDLLALYRERWGMEQMFQQVTEVFGLERLIGGRPEATIFQFAFCLLLYNQLQLVRAYVLKHQEQQTELVSLEQLFVDVRRELIAWAVVVGPLELPPRSIAETRRRLDQLLKRQWSDRWLKAIRAKPSPRPKRTRSKDHISVHRALLNAKT
jgi:hypothetical protein